MCCTACVHCVTRLQPFCYISSGIVGVAGATTFEYGVVETILKLVEAAGNFKTLVVLRQIATFLLVVKRASMAKNDVTKKVFLGNTFTGYMFSALFIIF